MNKSDHRFWPYQPLTSIFTSLLILLGLVTVMVILRVTIQWPGEKSESSVIMGILVFSLLPVVMALINVFAERGGSLEYKGLKLNFAQVPQMLNSGFTVPSNIGVLGHPIDISSVAQILDALREASACDVVIINLKDGHAWWETRLLVLLAGAVRHQRPQKVVFVGTDGGIDNCFQGWGHANDLLRCLLPAHPQYLRSFHSAQAAGRQWDHVEPVNPIDPATPGNAPMQPSWINTGLASQSSWIAFDDKGLPNPQLTEQMLATDLGEKVESMGEYKWITLFRMEELFRPVLHTQYIDESWQSERQQQSFFENNDDYFAVTQNRAYKTLVSRVTVHQTILKNLLESG